MRLTKREMCPPTETPGVTQPTDLSRESSIRDSPTHLVRQVLKHREPSARALSAGEEEAAATVITVMLRVQIPSAALLMVNAEHCGRLHLALDIAGFEVTVASTRDQALQAMVTRHHALAVTDRLELVRDFRELGCPRLLQIMLITGSCEREMEAALRAGADECLDRKTSQALLQARFAAARRTSDLEAALRTVFTEGRRLAMTDELTGVANRRFFATHYPREISRAARYGHPIAVAMFDIDHFKRINDRYGHSAGDAVLQQCAQRIQRCLRRGGTDWIARIGGEEFAVVLPEAELGQALSVCCKLREAISNEPFPSGGIRIRVTASIGLSVVASVPRDPKRIAERLLSAADRALYRCKEAGRDRVASIRLRFGRR
jgi:diguanylate cyclase (GGDEF)-like protein